MKGLTRRLRRGKRACSPKGRSIASDGDPKGCRGRAESPLLASMGNNFAVSNSPLRGNDAPTPARIGTGRPMGRSHFSFGGERKVCKRKPAARRLREKALYCPFLKEGVRNVARSIVGEITPTFVRARAHSFPLSKRARLFPSAAYRRSAPPQLAAGKRPLAGWDASLWPEGFAAWINGLIFFSPQLAWGRLNPCGLGCFLVAWIFLQHKRPAWFHLHAGLFREP